MTSKIQIDEQMIERVGKWIVKDAGRRHLDPTREEIRGMLEAALSPEEPEIPVSVEMQQAARDFANSRGFLLPLEFSEIYRAMEKARRKEEGQPTLPRGPFYSHCRKGEEICTRVGHRRKDDPK